MKKWMMIEIVVLAVVLAAAVAICFGPAAPAAPAMSDQIETTTQPPTTETIVHETVSEATMQPPVIEIVFPEITWMTFPEDRELTARQAFVYDCRKGEFIYLSGDEDEKVYPASVTKLFTAYVALQYLQPETVLTAGDALDLVGEGSSIAGIARGDQLTVEQLIEAMLLPSGNDAARILAVEVGRILAEDEDLYASRALQKFVNEMNAQAKEQGMTGTHFTNPDGYHDSDHYTTSKDLVTIGKLAMENPAVMKYTAVASETVTLGGAERLWENTNQLIVPESKYYCPYATGLKTGQTSSAGSCLLSSFEFDRQKYIIGVFGCPELTDRFADTLQLLNETIAQ